jgi:hypothetical protein
MTITALEQPQITGKWEAAMLAGSDPISAYWAMFLAHNQNEALETEFYDALNEMDDYEAKSSRDIVRKFIAIFDHNSCPETERQEALIAQAKAVLERGA